MCLPELILLPPSPKLRPHNHAAPRPLSSESIRAQPLLSSPPFIIQVSPKIPHHQSGSQRRRSSSRSTCEELEWREGFRAGRHAYMKRMSDSLERPSKTMTEPARTSISKDGCTESTRGKDGPSAPTSAPAPTSPPKRHETVAEPALAPSKPSLQPPPPPSVTHPKPAIPPSTTPPPRIIHQQHRPQPDPYIYEHRRLYSSRPRPQSPSASESESTSSRSVRALRKRLSIIWAHVSGLENWAQREEGRERERERERRVVIGQRGSRNRPEGRYARRGAAERRRRRGGGLVDPEDEWARSKWNMERGL